MCFLSTSSEHKNWPIWVDFFSSCLSHPKVSSYMSRSCEKVRLIESNSVNKFWVSENRLKLTQNWVLKKCESTQNVLLIEAHLFISQRYDRIRPLTWRKTRFSEMKIFESIFEHVLKETRKKVCKKDASRRDLSYELLYLAIGAVVWALQGISWKIFLKK